MELLLLILVLVVVVFADIVLFYCFLKHSHVNYEHDIKKLNQDYLWHNERLDSCRRDLENHYHNWKAVDQRIQKLEYPSEKCKSCKQEVPKVM